MGWTLPLREQYFRWFVTTASTYRGGNTFARALNTIKSDAVKNLSDGEQLALKPVLDLQPESRSPSQVLAARAFVKQWTADELVPVVERGPERWTQLRARPKPVWPGCLRVVSSLRR